MLLWMDQIGLCQCYMIEETFLHREPTLLLQVIRYPKRWKSINKQISDLTAFKEELGRNEIICK